MNYLVGLTALGGRDALSLSRMLARTAGVTLTVCVVVPETWGHPSPARVDAEYAKFLDRYAEEAIAEVRAFLGHGSDLFSWTAALFLDVVLED
jgi:hypothetical protein